MRKLAQKNLFYSVLLAAAMMLFLIGYFIWMLPSLYVDYTKDQNLEAVKKQHKAFVETGTYEGVEVKNPVACVSVKIPLEGNQMILAAKMISIKAVMKEPLLKQMLEDFQARIRNYDMQHMPQAEDLKTDSKQMSQLADKLAAAFKGSVNFPVDLEIIETKESGGTYYNESMKTHYASDHMIVLDFSVEDGNNQYTTYLAMEKVSDGMVFSILPVVTPQMEEIRPIVLQSLPMLGGVILMLVLIFSQIYSGGIVSPILKLVQHTQEMKADMDFSVQPLGGAWAKRKDEVAELAVTIDELYQQIKDSYQELQTKNQALLEENERQEVFLRASSHQLKTPITAALLLLDGMINQIGKYKDTKTYLPKAKEQLLSMRRMVEDILSLNQNRDNIHICEVCLYSLVQAQLSPYSVAAADKRLEIVLAGDKDACICTDSDILPKILDNLLSNAVNYTPCGEKITIFIDKQRLTIQNEGVAVPQETLQHIFEPFVRGNHEKQSHGLGLYIAAYYAKLIGAGLAIQNRGNSVAAVLDFEKVS